MENARMTTKELIDNLVQEYFRRKEDGEKHHQITEFYSLFYVNKHLSTLEKEKFCAEAILEILQYFKRKRKSFLESNVELTKNGLYELIKEEFPYQQLFQYCAAPVAKKISEDLVISFLDFYDANHMIKIYDERSQEYSDTDISSHLLYHNYVVDFVIHFLKYHPLTAELRSKLEQLKNTAVVQKWERHVLRIEAVINGEENFSDSKEEAEKSKVLSASEMATGKKWKALSENELAFIDSKKDFYALIEELSKIEYANKHDVEAKAKDVLDGISPQEYEVFILDLYNETKSLGTKRSSWFIGEKVIAFRIFVWLMHYLDTPNQYSILSRLAEKCFAKIPRVGPTSRKLGDVVLRILEESETIEGLGVLLNLKARTKYPVFRDALDSSIRNAINYSKLNPNEVEDFFINDYSLESGVVQFDFGDFNSKIEIENFSKVNLKWYKQDGKAQKSVPAQVKSAYASELKLWKAKQKDIKKDLQSQKQRFEEFWRKKKQWTFSNWQRYILDHELIKFLAQNLIWQFDIDDSTTLAIWRNGDLVASNGDKIENLSSSTVRLWHPCQSTIDEVQSWRAYILDQEIKQPFKQAFREIYLVTDAEISTSTYSNRFLNHIVRHHKFSALARQRTWTYGNVYAMHHPYIDYHEYDIRATFDLDNSHDLASTGRLHFRDTKKNEAIAMEEVPTILFSETMRDADLYVGVCSIGIEAEWRDTQHRMYWNNYSTADLSETAKTRRSVLSNLLPKLKINEQCELTDKYLKVTGKIRTYKIHLGSGNILMEPNDQNLCIVPDSKKKGKADGIFLPFDDDAIFSILLSKAFLLADDDKIEDQVILNQINQ